MNRSLSTLVQLQEPRRLRTSSADRPATRITLLRLFLPAAIVIEERWTFKSFAKNSMQASLARPSRGGAVSATFSESPISPVIASFFARGWTLMAKTAPSAVSRTWNMGIETYHRGTEPRRNLLFAIEMRFACVFRYLRLRPLSEDACAHAHTSRAFRDGNFEIVRHAHGEDGHFNARKPARADSITEFTQLSKVRTRSFRIIGEWRYGHEAQDVEVVELRCGFENGIE